MPTMPYSRLSATRQMRIKIAGKPKLGIVRHLDGLVLGIEFEQGRDRAKDFFLKHAHFAVDVGQDGRFKKIRTEIGAIAANNLFCALADGVGNESLHIVGGLFGNQWPNGGTFLGAITHFETTNGGGQFVGKSVVAASLYQDTVGANTGLASIAILADKCARDRRIQIGIVEDDKWCIATQFHRGAFYGLSTFGHQLLADRGGPGKG